MSGIRRYAVYNPRINTVLNLLLRILRAAGFLFLAVFLLHGGTACAADWATPEAQLAGKIVAATGPGAVAFEIANHSSLSASELAEITRGLRNQLTALGLQFVNPDQASATVTVSLSENLQGYVWVAEIHQGNNQSSVVMMATPRAGGLMTGRETSATVIHKAIIWSQATRILDVAVVDAYPPHMIVLDGEQVTLYKQQGNHWQMEQVMPVTRARAWPRDLRGRLMLRSDHLFDAYLPGVTCHSTATPPLSLRCVQTDDPWPLAAGPGALSGFYAPARNYFTGALSPGIGAQRNLSAFYSAAPLPRDKYTLWIFAGTDGQVHLVDGITDQKTAKLNWGSDIASVNTGCGGGWQVLASSPADRGSDSLRAFDVSDREPVAASQPLEFSGTITALWSETSGTNVMAIARNSGTGDYEAFRLSFACGQ